MGRAFAQAPFLYPSPLTYIAGHSNSYRDTGGDWHERESAPMAKTRR
jgi:hypothetical protein